MGNDGGSIPDRRDLVKNKPKAEQADKANQTRAKWFFCALSKRRLQEPVVSCALGKLYNKDAILEYLLDKTAYGDGDTICGHIRTLKDVKTLKVTPNTAPAVSDDPVDKAQFACPLTLKEMNGAVPFVYVSTCGCLFSQAGLKNTLGAATSSSSSPPSPPSPSAPSQAFDLCPQCATKFSRQTDVISINPAPADEERMHDAMLAKRASEPVKTKSSKKKRKAAVDAEEEEARLAKVQKASTNPSISAASRAITSELALSDAKRKAGGMSEAVKSLYGDGRPKRKETWATMGTFTRYA